MYTEQDGFDGIPGCCTHPPCGYHHHIFICHKYHVKNTFEQCNLDRFKSESTRDTNKTPTCAVPVHAPQMNALW